jgi:hypothetical protein
MDKTLEMMLEGKNVQGSHESSDDFRYQLFLSNFLENSEKIKRRR